VRVINTSTGVINTAAGICMSYGYSGDSGLATHATLNGPTDVEIDVGYGRLYIADSDNSAIRMLDKNTGIITTVAGTGTAGYGGDGGPGTSATLRTPNGLAFDTSSRILYISDTGNCAIRSLVVDGGLISTLVSLGYCGGSGYYGSTSYSAYGGIAVNPSTGTVYFTDPNGVLLKAVTVATLNVVTVAGNGIYGNAGDGGVATEASFGMLSSIAVNTTTGDIYIADPYYNVIRVVNISTGIINTVAGTGSAGYSGDGGLATSANLYSPTGISVHPTTGTMYISDTYNLRIRVLSSDMSNLGET
jgi:trimeric autotransporter adhesin